ncbi:hypothetical protein Taro_042614 [Colocasia esculenta]|uniref:DUF7358 domain-containing protein n=1 Tax=Colocasia esculenta TaxID=4460 RepID=A0A843WIV8_COLES|nr:hypothetical protein [Colocasia esculenta]
MPVDSPKPSLALPARLRQLLALLPPRDRHRRSPLPPRRMASFADERASLVSSLRRVRWVSVLLGVGNLGVCAIGGYLMASLPPGCWGAAKLPSAIVVVFALVRVMSMFGAALAQMETAATIAGGMAESSDAVDAMVRHERRVLLSALGLFPP